MALLTRPLQNEAIRGRAAPIIALGVAIALLYLGRVFFITLISALAIAFILEPLVALLMRIRFPRSLASFVVCTLALLIVYLVGAAAYSQAVGLIDELPAYGQRIAEIVDTGRQRVERMEQSTYRLILPSRQREAQAQQQQQAETARKRTRRPAEVRDSTNPPPIPEVRIHSDHAPLVEYFYSRIGSLYQVLLMVSFVPFLVYFMLSWRDHVHRSFLHFFHGEDRAVAAKSLQGIAELVRAYVVGNFMLGVLLAIVSSITFWKLRLPYPWLAGFLSGFLSLVPYIGLPLALVPPVFTALPVYRTISAYLLLAAMVALFHLLSLNLLYPKIVGSRVHLNPLVVTVALMIWGFLWDAAGLVLAIPLTAAIKAVCDNVAELRPYGKFLGD